MRGMAFFFLTLHVRKTMMCHRGAWKAGWEFPNVTRPEQKVRGMAFFFPTLHVRKTRKRKTWLGGAAEGTAEQHRKAGAQNGTARQEREGLRGKGIGYSQRFDYFCSI